MSLGAVTGPFWGGREARIAGRYPLSVERHVVSQVGRLLPGITAVTPHARYYTLHALVAHEAARRGLVASETQALLRRVEVVMGAISLTHGNHPGLALPHGGDRLRPSIEAGAVDVQAMSMPGAYAESSWGFWAPYRGSETLLGLTRWEGPNIAPGPAIPEPVLHDAVGPVVELASSDTVDRATLEAHAAYCLCMCADAGDGEHFREVFVPAAADPLSNGGRRGASVRLMLRIFQLQAVGSVTRDVWPILAYDPGLAEDSVCGALEVTDAWRGLVLRNQSVSAWRELWAEQVNSIDGLITVGGMAEAFADRVPAVTTRAYRDALPDVADGEVPLPAELDESVGERETTDKCVALLLLGAARVGTVPERVAAYFEPPTEAMQELTPSWVANRAAEWDKRPLQDFARWLTEVLVARSQRVALRKAQFARTSGTFRVPARLYARDGLLFRDSDESGFPVGYRWDPLSSVMAGAGLCTYGTADDSTRMTWRTTERGQAMLS
jgi:hypothetical protein